MTVDWRSNGSLVRSRFPLSRPHLSRRRPPHLSTARRISSWRRYDRWHFRPVGGGTPWLRHCHPTYIHYLRYKLGLTPNINTGDVYVSRHASPPLGIDFANCTTVWNGPSSDGMRFGPLSYPQTLSFQGLPYRACAGPKPQRVGTSTDKE